MKKIIIVAIVTLLAGASNAYCAGNIYPEDENVIVEEPQSRSTSTSTSTSSKNGKTVTRTTTATSNSNVKGVKSLKDLAVYPLFEKFKRYPNTKLTEIEGGSFYRNLSVNNDSKVMAEITKAFEIDAKKASSNVKNYDEFGDNAVLGILVGNNSCTIGYQISIDGASGHIFVSCPVAE